MSAQDTLALVLEASDGQVGTHYHRCYLEHAPCLAQLLVDAGEVPVEQDALADLLELAAEAKADRTAEAWARSLRETNDSPERAAQLRDLAEQIGITL